jgi:AI-2 transport protein TqsA
MMEKKKGGDRTAPQSEVGRKASASLQKERTWLSTVCLVILATVAICVALSYAGSVLMPFVLAVFVFVLVSPILDFQVLRLRFARVIAVIVTLLIVLIILTILFLLVARAAQSVASTAGQYSDNFIAFVRQVLVKLEEWGLDINDKEILGALQGKIPAFAAGAFGTAVGFVSKTFLIAVFVAFLLAGRNPTIISTGIYAEIDSQVRRYIATKTVLSAATGLLVWLTLWLFKLEAAGVFGLLAFILNFIPSIGSVIATLLPLPVAIAQYQSPWLITAVVLVPGAIQMSIGNGLEPKLMGSSLKLHPVIILLALSFWGLLWGIPGMFLAVPITAVIRIVFDQFATLRPVADALSGKLPNIDRSAAE